MFLYEIGIEVKDIDTGMRGMIVGRSEYTQNGYFGYGEGENQYLVVIAKALEGASNDIMVWLKEDRLMIE